MSYWSLDRNLGSLPPPHRIHVIQCCTDSSITDKRMRDLCIELSNRFGESYSIGLELGIIRKILMTNWPYKQDPNDYKEIEIQCVSDPSCSSSRTSFLHIAPSNHNSSKMDQESGSLMLFVSMKSFNNSLYWNESELELMTDVLTHCGFYVKKQLPPPTGSYNVITTENTNSVTVGTYTHNYTNTLTNNHPNVV